MATVATNFVQLNVYCADIHHFTRLYVEPNISAPTLLAAVARADPDYDEIYLVPHGMLTLTTTRDLKSVSRNLLQGRTESEFDLLEESFLKPWIRDIHDHRNDLHIVTRSNVYPPINVYDTGRRCCTTTTHVKVSSITTAVLPGRLENYDLYQAPEGIRCTVEEEIQNAVSRLDLSALQRVRPAAALSGVAPWGFLPDNLHFIVVPVAAAAQGDEDLNTLSALPSRLRRRFFDQNPKKPPSSEAKAGTFTKAQRDEKTRIYCGRPFELVRPPSLLDPTLAQLRYDITHIVPSARDIQCYASIRDVARQTYENEAVRRDAFVDILTNCQMVPDEPKRGDTGRYTNDGDLRARFYGARLLYAVFEIKWEVGTGASDPLVEAIHYWFEQIRVFLDFEDKHDRIPIPTDVLEKLNFPAVLVLHFGPYIAIAIATFADKPNVEHLACIPLHVHSSNTAEIEAGERVLAALRVALFSLRDRYPDITSTRETRGDYPFRDFYEDTEGRKHSFEYVKALEDKRVFSARLTGPDGGRPVYIKFSRRYSEDAHRAASRFGFAPKLYAVNRVYDWFMVVMEDSSAEYTTLWDLRYQGHINRQRLEDAQTKVRDGLDHLHEQGFVHGDVRDVNVLIRNDGAAEPGPDILLVDWDWAGEASTATYPHSMNCEDIIRPDDARPGEQIKAEHDTWMTEYLLEK